MLKPKLMEIAWYFRATVSGAGQERQFVIRAALLHGELDLTFSIPGREGASEMLPAILLEAIKEGLAFAAKSIRIKDLAEMDVGR